ncbi:MAG: NADH-quinone oxidoreductase subunit NuoE [Oscillospiraceae bacterium]|nr:NADH-quinone oxidoreductase subunit NuoE [Oscillospiraceae bacterium]
MPDSTTPALDLTPLEPVLDEYAAVPGSLITILQKTQELYGYLPMDALYRIAEATGSSPAQVLGTASFYSQFRFKPMGKHLILLCKGTACHVNGADAITLAVMNELDVANGDTTEDGLFSLSLVACLGCCSLAPVMMIDERTYGRLTPDKARQILRDIRKEEQA